MTVQLRFVFFPNRYAGTENGAAGDGAGAEFAPDAVHCVIQFFAPLFLLVDKKRLLNIFVPGQFRQRNSQQAKRRMSVPQMREQAFGNAKDLVGNISGLRKRPLVGLILKIIRPDGNANTVGPYTVCAHTGSHAVCQRQ